MLNRLFALVARINLETGCTDAICSDLGIVGPEETTPDTSTITPDIKAKRSGNHVLIDWGWQGYSKYLHGIDILVDRGTGYAPLTTDSTPDYTDTHPHPATSAIWKYKAIYRVDDNQVGQWSQEVSVVVGG